MKVLITGANGQLGWELQRTVPKQIKFLALNRNDLDITDLGAVQRACAAFAPELIINSAAYTHVDQAEKEPERAYSVNADGAKIIAQVASDVGCRLIHLSTDFVFDGKQSWPYMPGDVPNPISAYGASKLQGEQAVLTENVGKALILRTAWVYSSRGNNFVTTMLRLMNERDSLQVVADQIGTPTWAKELAQAIWRIADKTEMHGIYHWTDAGVASWYDFAVAILEEAKILRLQTRPISIRPIRTQDYPTPAKRPFYGVMEKTNTWTTLGITASHWRVNLRAMLKELHDHGLAAE